MMMKIGFLEDPDGEVWDHKGKTELVQIFISYDDDDINFLQFQYVDNGNLVLSEPSRSVFIGNKFNIIKLNYPDEFLTSISGSYYRTPFGETIISSITFGTNRGCYGPFGVLHELGCEFNFQMGLDRQFGGFHGSTQNGKLESIGVYVKPNSTLNNPAGKVKEERV